MTLPPELPHGRRVTLPGRGTTFIRELHVGHVGPDAPALILLHGWTVTTAINWFLTIRPLALGTGLRVIGMDQRGHGRGVQPRALFRLEDCADDVAALADALHVPRFIPVGYSMGGAIAQLVARRHRDRVAGLVLCSTAAFFGPENGSRGVWDLIAPAMATGLTVLPLAARQRLLDRFLMYRGNEVPAWMKDEIRRNDPAMVMQAGIVLGKFDARPWLGELTMPSAVVRTTADETVSPRRQTVLADGLPKVRLFDVAAGHRAAVTEPDLFVPKLLEAVAAVR